MKQSFSRALKIGALAAVVGIGAGCATTGDLDEVRTMVEEAQAAAEAAQQSADQAQTSADTAQQTADQAESTADAAAQAAQESESCCDANTERLDRMFQRSQQK